MILLEVFNTPYKYDLLDQYENINFKEWSYIFKVSNGDTVYVLISLTSDAAGYTSADLSFERGDGNTDITGDGDAYRIFATVISIMAEFIKSYSADVIRFTASKEDDHGEVTSRVKLYDRMVNRFASSFGYSFSVSDNSEEKIYYLEKKEG